MFYFYIHKLFVVNLEFRFEFKPHLTPLKSLTILEADCSQYNFNRGIK